MRRFALMAAAAVLLGGALTAAAGELDGTTWKAKGRGFTGVVQFWKSDVMKFAGDQFTSENCIPYGFKTGPYVTTKAEDAVHFQAEQMNDKGEKIYWEGVRTGDRMVGQFTWSYKNKKGVAKTKVVKWKAKLVH